MDYRKDQPSVKLHHAPGGASSFSLGWDAEPKQAAPKQGTAQVTSPFATEEQKAPVTSVKVHHAPAGQSNFSLSDGSQNTAVTSVKVHHAPGGQSNFSLSDGS
jgi:hypothetical protein